ncbi:hypothetical protein QZH41_008184 [Actinostola sp. cb2023]|nr:hypothetical protein QZH41_008184 [Actinostola sp. cb2023]
MLNVRTMKGPAKNLNVNPRWMLSGPELARLLQQFEGEYIQDDDPENPLNFQNHEAGRSTQKTFQRQVNNLTDVVRRMGNPFLDDFQELVRLDSRDCLDASVANAIRTLDNLGKQQYQTFLKDVIEERKKSIHDPIKRKQPSPLQKAPPQGYIQARKEDCSAAE